MTICGIYRTAYSYGVSRLVSAQEILYEVSFKFNLISFISTLLVVIIY